MTAAARALGVVHNPAPRLNLPVKDDAKFVSDRIRARLYRDPRIDPTAKFVAVTIAEWAGDRNMKAWPAQLTLSRTCKVIVCDEVSRWAKRTPPGRPQPVEVRAPPVR